MTDLVIINFLQKFIYSRAKIFLHFHQFNKKEKKVRSLQKIANNNQTINIFTPTDKLTKTFQDSNFKNCKTVCCPSFIRNNNNAKQEKTFKKIIYAGAARKDKGFPKIVKLLTFFGKQKNKLTI